MNSAQRWFNLIGKTAANAVETINLTQNRMGSINNDSTYPGVFTSATGSGFSTQNLNVTESFLIDLTSVITNYRVFFYTDLGANTGAIVSGKLYMKYTPAPDSPPNVNRYLYRGTQPQAPSFGSVSVYNDFTTQLSGASTIVGNYVVFTLNAAGIAELTTKGTQSFCIRNEYDVNNTNPLAVSDMAYFSLVDSYFELIH